MAARIDRKLLATGVLLLLLAGVAWRVLSLGMAEQFARTQPVRALSWRSDHPVALVLQAERLAASGRDAASASRLARQALQANPLDGRGFRVLGRLAADRGDLVRAARFHALAVTRSPRDLPSHAWLFEHELRSGKVAKALVHADLMLRVQPELKARLFPILIGLAGDESARPALARLLAKAPPWREKFLQAMLAEPGDSRQLVVVLDASAGSGLSRTELAAWLERLTADQAWDQAYVVWASQLPPGTPALANLYNGGFESEVTGLGFDWRFEHVPGASIEVLAGPGVSGQQALSVGFDHQRVPFRHVRQLLLLSPGRYLLEGHQRAEDLRTPRGLSWSVACAGSTVPLVATAPLKGNSDWTEFAVEWVVPDGGCPSQWLELALLARVDSEQMVSGRAWYDDMRIVRLR